MKNKLLSGFFGLTAAFSGANSALADQTNYGMLEGTYLTLGYGKAMPANKTA